MAVFGPVYSRRFGMSLGIDVVAGQQRECNFDCLYCELPSSPKTAISITPESPESLINSAKEAIDSGKTIDVLTVTANGEPTIYPHLAELIDGLNAVKTTLKTLILSNGSTICDAKVREALMKFDIVKLSLDSARSESYKKIDRPIAFELERTVACMVDFAGAFKGELVLETLFVAGVNDGAADIEALKTVYEKISPARIDISTIDRPPAFAVSPITEERLFEIADELGLPNISVAIRKAATPLSKSYTETEWLNTLQKRPLTLLDARYLADTKSYEMFLELIKTDKIIKKNVAGVEFFGLL